MVKLINTHLPLFRRVCIGAAMVLAVSCGGDDDKVLSEASPQQADAVGTINDTAQASAETPQATAGGATTDPSTDETASASAAQSASDEPSDQAALLKRGKILYFRCRTCHTLEEGGRHTLGPNLYGIFGAAAGARDDFTYSDVLTDSGVVWNDETMSQWIEKPQSFIPGNKMAFPGLPKAEDRAALIAYLKAETQ